MSFVDELEQAIDIVDLVWRYTKLKKTGVNYKSLCPFPGHSESTPSFVVSPAKQIGYCFGCHKWGGPLKFLMDIENCEFREAVEMLASITGREVEGFKTKSKQEIRVQKNMYSLYRDATKYYSAALTRSPDILKYLFERGITDEDRTKFHFWYADSGVALYNFLKEKWYTDELIANSQIFVDLSRKKDKFIWRVIFPLQNNRGDFVAFAWRIVWTWEPKYLNSPASDIYDKSSLLYGLFEAKNTITKNNRVIICEGYVDVIALHRAWYYETVAVSGTALSEKHITLIKRLTRKIYLCFDSDKAWVAATKNSLELLKNKELEIHIIQIPSGKDPDEYIESGKDFWKLLESALSPIAFALKHQNYDLSSLDDMKKFLKEMLDYVASFSDMLERDFYLKELAHLTGTKLEIIYALMKEQGQKTKTEDKNPSSHKAISISTIDYIVWLFLEKKLSKSEIDTRLLFPEALPSKVGEILSWEREISSLSLEENERYKSFSLELSLSEKTEAEMKQYIEKLFVSVNKEHFKILEYRYKKELSDWSIESLKKYTEVLKKAKEAGIK